MNPVSLESLIEAGAQVYSLPQVLQQVNELLDDPNASHGHIGQVLSHDSAMTARVLKLVNSSFYGLPGRVDSISRAITLLGARELRDLLTTTWVLKAFHKIPRELIDMAAFWRHSVYVAALAKPIARHAGVLHTERMFVAGMLHDIGKPLIYAQLPDLARSVLLISEGDSGTEIAAEQEILGFTHAEAGAGLLRAWGLPQSLIESTLHHHQPGQAKDYALEAAVIHAANAVANGEEHFHKPAQYIPHIEPATRTLIQWDSLDLPALLLEAGEAFESALSLLDPAN
ncbi:MAG: HDOD domain-containing protein [Chromatiales bacterium]|nr:HDOD domain-containing protein [Chromatiales bacterium]